MPLEDELVNRVTWKIPNALALVGSAADGERNGMTTSWITQLAMEPVLIGIGVDNSAVTHRLITEGGSFTVNLWDSEETRPFVKFSKPATDDGATLNGRPVRDGVTGKRAGERPFYLKGQRFIRLGDDVVAFFRKDKKTGEIVQTVVGLSSVMS